MRDREIFRRAPGLSRRVRPLDLGGLPTPLVEEPELARAWGCASLHVKRDDATSPLGGGTKVRALEYHLGAARQRGAEGVVTAGAAGSHHVLATAFFARSCGLRARAVLFPQPPDPAVALNARLLPESGAEVLRCRSLTGLPAALLRARLGRLGDRRPAWIPPGGSSPLGALGMAEGGLELAGAVREGRLPAPDDVVVAAGTCGTAAGLLLGLAVGGLSTRVVAVRVVPRLVGGPGRLRRLAAKARRCLQGAGLRVPPLGGLLWVGREAGRGYARPTPGASRAVEMVVRLGGFPVETTYTGKALAFLQGGGLAGRRVVFWNTYGPWRESGAPPAGR